MSSHAETGRKSAPSEIAGDSAAAQALVQTLLAAVQNGDGRPALEQLALNLLRTPATVAPVVGLEAAGAALEENRAARDAAFLDRLSLTLAPLTAPAEIIGRACEAVGTYLQVKRCNLPQWQPDLRRITIEADWCAPDSTSVNGKYDLDEFGAPALRRRMLEGSVSIPDVELDADLKDFAEPYRALKLRAFATSRFVRGERAAVTIVINTDVPRVWLPAELALLENSLARVWPLVERARAEADVRAVAQRLTLAMKVGRLGDWTWDAAANTVTLAGAAAEIIGLPSGICLPREELGRYLHPDDVEPTRRIVGAAMATRSEYQMEYRLRRPDGSYAWIAVQGSGVFAADGALLSVVGVMQEISERKQAEEKLRAQETQLRFISSNAPTILAHLDRDGRFLFVNKAFADRWKLAPEQIVGRTITEVAGVEALAVVQHHIQRVLAGETVEFENEVNYEGLGRRYMKATYAPDVGPDGRVRGWLSAAHDLTDRWEAERALRASEEQLRLATSAGKLGIWSWDIAGNRIHWTDSLYEIHGVRREEFKLTMEGFTALIHPEDYSPVRRAIQSTLEHDIPYELEFRIVRPNGAIIWVFTNGAVMRDPSGRALRMLGATLDITARKSAELALRESEGRFRALASHAPVGIFLTDAQGATVFVNESWCAMTGLTPKDARGDGWRRAIHPEDRERVIADWQESMRRGVTASAEYRFRHADGKITWVQGRAVRLHDDAGRPAGYIGTIADFTPQKRDEEKLHQRNERLQFISEALAALLDARDPAALVHELLPRVARHLEADTYFNYMMNEAGDALMLHAYGGVTPEKASTMQRIEFGQAICGTVAATRQPMQAKDIQHSGEEKAALARSLGLQAYACNPFMVDNRLLGTLSFATRTRKEFQPDELDFMRSITRYVGLALDRARARERLQAHAAELEQKVQERTASLREAIVQMEEFSYSVSHDLRAPLRAMDAYAEALMEDYGGQLDATARDYLERIRRSSRRMDRLTHDVLTYGRIARADVVPSTVDPDPLLRDVIAQYAELQPPKAVIEIIGPLPILRGHEVSLGQALANLLTNAAKFVAPGVQPHIRVRAERSGNHARLWVEDNGIGIDPRHNEHIFRIFERLPTRHPYDGTGIGLAIVRKAIDKMGGRCGVESDGVNGSRFWIELPVA